jgi:hypothetical protein
LQIETPRARTRRERNTDRERKKGFALAVCAFQLEYPNEFANFPEICIFYDNSIGGLAVNLFESSSIKHQFDIFF